jgi:hypothetical protein
MPSYVIFRQGDFLTSIRETMLAPATSPTASCGPPVPIPGQPTPSPRLRQRRVRLVSPKSMGKCLTYNTFGQAIFDEIFQDCPFAKSSPLQSISPPFASSNTFDNHVSSLPFICSKYVIAFSRPTSRCLFRITKIVSTFVTDKLRLFPAFVVRECNYISMCISYVHLLSCLCADLGVLDCAKSPPFTHPVLMHALDPILHFISQPPPNIFHLPLDVLQHQVHFGSDGAFQVCMSFHCAVTYVR